MTLADLLGLQLPFRVALALGIVISLATALVAMPKTLPKLRGAGITGTDRHKRERPEIPEMGGLVVFLAFNVGAFAVLGLGDLPIGQQRLLLASLVVAAGALITGVLDDLLDLRQRFKALIPFAFAAPLALFVTDTAIVFPLVGRVEFDLAYSLLLVPVGVACASNGFNMLEGFNGLGASLGIVMASTMVVLSWLKGSRAGLVLLFPLIGALGGFLYFNSYPADVLPGDSMTLTVGAVLASAAILGKIEFWGAFLFLPHVLEFFLKARLYFPDEGWGGALQEDGRLVSERDTPVGLAQFSLKTMDGLKETELVSILLIMQTLLGAVAVLGAILLGG